MTPTRPRPTARSPWWCSSPAELEVPRLQTERLLLREWREDDLDAYAETYADPEVMRFLGGPVPREQVWRHIALLAGHWQLRGYGQWVLERREDGRFVGRA